MTEKSMAKFDSTNLIGAGIGAVGNIVGTISNNKNIKRQIAAQREENEKNRAWNQAQAERANQWSIDQWNRENAYNTPYEQMARMRSAGLNPDMMYQNGSSANVASSSPSVTPTAPSDPINTSNLANLQTVGDVMNNTLASTLAASQIKKTEAEANKTGAETNNVIIEGQILSADALVRAAQNEQSLLIGQSQIYVNHSVASLNHAEQEHISAKITNLAASTEEMYQRAKVAQATIKNVNANTAATRFSMMMKAKEFRLEVQKVQQSIKESNSRIRLNDEQVSDWLATRAARVLGLNSQSALNASNVATNYTKRENIRAQTGMYEQLDKLVGIQADQAAFNLDSDETFKDIERSVAIGESVTRSIGNIVDSASSFVSGGKMNPAKLKPVKGF